MSRKLLFAAPMLLLFAAGCSPTSSDVTRPIVGNTVIPVQTPVSTTTPVSPPVTQPATTTTAVTTTTSTAQVGAFTFVDQTIKEDGKTLAFDITYPQMSGAADAAMQKQFNQIVYEKNIRDQVAQMRTDNANAVKEGMMTSAAWSLDLGGGVTYQSPRLINVFLDGSQDTGGAHPNAYYENVLFDPSLKKEILVSDLFTDASSSLQLLATWTRAELKKNTDMLEVTDPDWMAGGTDPTQSNYQFSHLTADGLVVLFPPYQVAAYVAGPQEITIPWEKVNPLLKAEYQKK